MPESGRFTEYFTSTYLEFVEREATPLLLINLSIHFYLAEFSILNIIFFLIFLVSIVHDLLRITGLAEPSFSRSLVAFRITLPWTQP